MRSMQVVALLLVCAVLIGGCGSSRSNSERPAAASPTKAPPSAYANGDPAAGKAVFNQMECAACHTLSAAGATGTVGPNLDLLHREAARAGQPLGAFTASAIVDPDAHPVPGYPSGVMPSYRRLSSSQIADLVAYLTATR